MTTLHRNSEINVRAHLHFPVSFYNVTTLGKGALDNKIKPLPKPGKKNELTNVWKEQHITSETL